MKRLLTYLLCLLSSGVIANNLITLSKDTILMGVSFSFTTVSDDLSKAEVQLYLGIEEVGRIESLISSWDANSQTSLINSMAGIAPVKVDRELFDLIKRSIKISEMTKGKYDISVVPLIDLWSFQSDDPISELPNTNQTRLVKELVGYKMIILDDDASTVFLQRKGMKIGFGSIGKGYAANRAKSTMNSMGSMGGVVNAGGDLICWGNKPSGDPWTIGVVNPKNKNEVLSWLDITNVAVVTSGNYEKFITIDGVDYSHIINPISAQPVVNLSSVTVICADAELADALATSIFVIGKEDGLKLVNHLDNVESVIIDENQEMHFSEHLEKKYIIINE